MPRWRPLPDRPLLDRPPNYDHDFDGRPPVGDDDPLLAALMREHPELIPAELVARERIAPRRASLLASIPTAQT